jgi:hypothetical protein
MEAAKPLNFGWFVILIVNGTVPNFFFSSECYDSLSLHYKIEKKKSLQKEHFHLVVLKSFLIAPSFSLKVVSVKSTNYIMMLIYFMFGAKKNWLLSLITGKKSMSLLNTRYAKPYWKIMTQRSVKHGLFLFLCMPVHVNLFYVFVWLWWLRRKRGILATFT